MKQAPTPRVTLQLRHVSILSLLASAITGCSADQVVGRDESNAELGTGGASRGGVSGRASGGTRESSAGGSVSGSSTGAEPDRGGSAGDSSVVAPAAGSGGIAGVDPGRNLGGSAGADLGGTGTGGAPLAFGGSAGAYLGGAGAGGTPLAFGGSAGFCAGLEGTWTARFALDTWTDPYPDSWPSSSPPTVPTNCWISENGIEPAFETAPPGALGISLTSADGKCIAKLYPEFGSVISAEMVSTEGGLVLDSTTSRSLRWCHPMDWQLDELTLVNAAVPTARLESPVVGSCDDMSFVSRTTWNGTLTPGLFGQALRLDVDHQNHPVCGWTTSLEAPLRVLPWHFVTAVTARPPQSVSASGVNPELPAPWPMPLSYAPAQSMTTDLLWMVYADDAAPAYLEIARTNLAAAFEGDTLAQMTTKGARTLELVNGRTALRVTGKACTVPIWAGGRLQVAGKQRVVFEVEPVSQQALSSTTILSRIQVQLIDPDRAVMPRPTWRIVEGTNIILETIILSGQSEVGVELGSSSPCTPMAAALETPDVRIYGIRAE